MRKIVLTLAALAAVGFVVPMTTSAKAEGEKEKVVIKERGERHRIRSIRGRRVVTANRRPLNGHS